MGGGGGGGQDDRGPRILSEHPDSFSAGSQLAPLSWASLLVLCEGPKALNLAP